MARRTDKQTTDKEIAQRGQEMYEARIRSQVEAEHKGKFLVLDVESGDYEIDVEGLAASERVQSRHPDASLYLVRIGFQTAYQMGGRLRVGSK